MKPTIAPLIVSIVFCSNLSANSQKLEQIEMECWAQATASTYHEKPEDFQSILEFSRSGKSADKGDVIPTEVFNVVMGFSLISQILGKQCGVSEEQLNSDHAYTKILERAHYLLTGDG